jgi:hypothetical protein
MKKILISIGSILIMALVVVLFVNASESKKEAKKAKAEVTKTEAAMPCAATCSSSAMTKTAACDPSKSKEMKCTLKDGKCDPATCPMHKEGTTKECPATAQTAPCPATCPAKSAEIK